MKIISFQLNRSGLGRNRAAGRENFNLWDFRHELEYGVSDDYSLSLYVNESLTNFRQPASGHHISDFEFDGISLENRFQVLNAADQVAGLTLYLEPRVAGDSAELEQRIILGQRFGDWKWALIVTHAVEWLNDYHHTEGELELSLGITRRLNPQWSVGVEARDHNELPDYAKWENTAFFLGPVVTYQRERWWATLTVMPQLFGANFAGNADANHQLDLESHERCDVRLILGFSF